MIKNATEIIQKGNELIHEVISQFVTLKRQGVNHKGKCPFHDEKTPSFVVNSTKGYYKCFGCGQGGDSIQFLMDFKHLEFKEAVELLSTYVRISPDYSNRDPEVEEAQAKLKVEKKTLSETLNYAFAIYRNNKLPYKPHKNARYSDLATKKEVKTLTLDTRDYQVDIIEKYKVAWAGDPFLVKSDDDNLDPDNLIKLGLINENESKHRYDTFQNRILFPIYRHTGDLVGLAGRVTSKDKNPNRAKYINSRQSALYNKSEILFGLSVNLKAISKEDQAILMEGYTDVMTVDQYGFPIGVASCGTAFTLEQAKLIKRFAKELIIMRDGDEAGQDATRKDIDTAVCAGLSVKVCFLPTKHDPDSYARKWGYSGLKKLIDNAQDGIIWRVMEGWDSNNVFKQEASYQLAASLLCFFESDILRESYVQKLSAKEYMGGIKNVAKHINSAIEEKKNLEQRKGFKALSYEQASNVQKYGIFKYGNMYKRSSDQELGTGQIISNFIIEPIMLIVAKQEQHRLMKITNTFKQSFFIDMPSDVFVNFQTFKKVIEGQGNYLYNENAKESDHIKIKRMIYPKMPKCFPIYTMGWHSKGGFWTWANGITVNGKFRKVDEYGVVEHEKIKYWLPYFSSLKDNIFSDDDEDGSEDQTNFAFTSYPESISFKEWTRIMYEVHGKNSMVAIAWMLSALFRDIIYKKMNSFPILNFFGPTRTGKSFLAWCLMYLFGGKAKGGFNINKGTSVALGRNFSWVRNGIGWIDEFSDDIPHDRFEFLKSVFDGLGREKGIGSFSHKTTRTPVNSACLLTGEHQPTKSASLFARTISLDFPVDKNKKSLEWQRKADGLSDINVTGQLTQLTSMLLKYRNDIEERFNIAFDDIRTKFREHFDSYRMEYNSQLLSNYCVIMAVAKIVMERLEFHFKFEELQAFAIDRIVSQSAEMGNQDEAAIFFKIISYLINKEQPSLSNGKDILVKYETKVTKLKGSKQLTWDESKKILYLNFSRSIEEYNIGHQRSRNKPGLPEGTIKYYLRNMEAFLGEKASHRFGDSVLKCFVFDADLLPLDFPITPKKNTLEENPDLFSDQE